MKYAPPPATPWRRSSVGAAPPRRGTKQKQSASDATHLRRLRLGDLSRWVRRGWSCRADAKARPSSPRPTRFGTSRYKYKSGSTLPNLPARVCRAACSPDTTAHHGEARVACPGNADPSRDSIARAKSLPRFGVRPEVSVSARRLCEHGNAHRRAADPMSTATSRASRTKADPMSTATSRTNRTKADPMSSATDRE